MPLPYLLQQVADIAGEEAALQLARARGGTRMYVPQRPTAPLLAAIGEPAARALSSLYANETITVPMGPTGSLHEAGRMVDEAIIAGLSTREVAQRFGVAERTISRRKAVLRAQKVQIAAPTVSPRRPRATLGPGGSHADACRLADEGFAAGLSMAEIAQRSGLSRDTVCRRRLWLRASGVLPPAPPALPPTSEEAFRVADGLLLDGMSVERAAHATGIPAHRINSRRALLGIKKRAVRWTGPMPRRYPSKG